MMTTNTDVLDRLERVADDAEYATKALNEVTISEGEKDITLVDGTKTPNLNKRLAGVVSAVQSVNGKKGKVTLEPSDLGLLTTEQTARQNKLDRFVITEDGRNQREVNAEIPLKANKAYVDERLSGNANAQYGAYETLAKAQADSGKFPKNSSIMITNDGARSGLYLWDGSRLIKSDYDPLEQSKKYLDENFGKFKPSAVFVHNWNEIKESGQYRSNPTSQAAIGAPEPLAHLILNHVEATGGRAMQIAFSAARSKMWHRGRLIDGSWMPWILITPSTHSVDLKSAENNGFYLDGSNYKELSLTSDLWGKTLESGHPKYTDLIKSYDDLMLKNPSYITKESKGFDDFDNEIFTYSFKAPNFRWKAPATPQQNAHPKIILVGGMHAGSEKQAIATTLLFFQELCNNWKSSKILSELRWGAEIILLPCLNPYGYDNKTRRNGNNVDMNHNFGDDWGGLESQYKGDSPMDQPESKIAAKLAEDHPTAKTFIDFHSHDNDFYTWIGTRSKDGFSIQKNFLREHQAWFFRNFFRDTTENRSQVTSAGTTATGLATYWTEKHGKKGFLLEMQQNNTIDRRSNRMIGFHALEGLIYANWKKESEETSWV